MSERPSCDYCGDLGWTVERYGRVTHKEACPHRTDPWTQAEPMVGDYVRDLEARLREAERTLHTIAYSLGGRYELVSHLREVARAALGGEGAEE